MGFVQAAEFKAGGKETPRVASLYFGTSLLLMVKKWCHFYLFN